MDSDSTSSDDEVTDLDARIAKYSNINTTTEFTDSDSDDDDDDKDDDDESDSDESNNEEEEDDDIEADAQTESFNVSIRVRPLFSKEKMLKYKSILKVMDDKYVILKNPQVANKNDYLSMKRDRQKRFCFDNVFEAQIPTYTVYKKTVRRVIKSILEGYNATVFAYGATGSGKTYTMLGSDIEPGIMVHTLRDLFTWKDKQTQYTFRIVISFLEIYNENIRDLLVSSHNKKKRKYLDLRETPKKGVIIQGIAFKTANDVGEVMELLSLGNKRRTVESTAANKVSSRSHAVLQIYVERKSNDVLNRDIRCGKLNLIDLAGSEKGSVVKSGARSQMREGANINKSLLALSKCINSLVDKKKFIPFRDSKLTRLLQDALGGNCKTVMICALSPSSFTWDDTHNTLKYADRAKNIRIKKAEINKMKNDNKNDLNQVIKALKEQVLTLKGNLTVIVKEKKAIQRKSKLFMKQQTLIQQEKDKEKEKEKQKQNSLGLLSEKDMEILTKARDKIANKMMNLSDLHAQLEDLNDEETNLLSQEISMKQMLQFSMNNELHENYKRVVNKLSDIKLEKMDIERRIKMIASNTDSEIKGLGERSHSKHLHTMLQKENELFLAQIDNKTTHLNMSFMENKYLNQENEMNKLQQENQTKYEDLQRIQQQLDAIKDSKSEQEQELKKELTVYKSKYEQETKQNVVHFEQQLNDLKQQLMEQETKSKNEQEEKETELKKQITFYQRKYEDDNRQSEMKFEKDLHDLKQQLIQQKEENEKHKAPKRKENIKPSDIPYTKWDADDVYFWLCDDLNIDDKYAKLIYDEGFDGDGIVGIKEDDLKEIGVSAMGIRRKIVRNIDLLQQNNNLLSTSASTLADSVAWNSMYRGSFNNGVQRNQSMTESVFSDMTSVSQMDAKRQMKAMQEQLISNPQSAENPQFMMQMLQIYASSQNLLPQIPQNNNYNNNNNNYNNNNNMMPPINSLPEEKEISAEITDEMEEKSQLPLTETAGGPGMMDGELTPMHSDMQIAEHEVDHGGALSDTDEHTVLMKEKKKEAKKAVHALVHELHASIGAKKMDNIAGIIKGDDMPLTPSYNPSEYDIKFGNDDNEDSDDNRPYDYDETWMFADKDKSFTIVLLSPYKSLRKAFLKFCFEPDVIKNRKRTLSYKRYEKSMKCGDREFIFRILECYESNYIADLFDNQLVQAIFMIFPLAVSDEAGVNKETQFMHDLDTWMYDSGHWESFWAKSVRMLDGSLSFKKYSFASKKDYFDANEMRKKSLNDLFDRFKVDNVHKAHNLKWLNIETNRNTKLKIKENKRKYKYKWPNVPKQSDDEMEDWRSPLTLKVFNALNEPNKSYFLTSALFSPQMNLIAPTFISTAQSAAKNGPYGYGYGVKGSDDDEDDVKLQITIEKTQKKAKKKKKKKEKIEKIEEIEAIPYVETVENIENIAMDNINDDLHNMDDDDEYDDDGLEVAEENPVDTDTFRINRDDLEVMNDDGTMKINRDDMLYTIEADGDDMDMDMEVSVDGNETFKIARNDLEKAKSIELRQAETENVMDTAAEVEDMDMIAASAPPIMAMDDDASAPPITDDETIQKQLMQEAFAKFQQKQQDTGTPVAEPYYEDDAKVSEEGPMMENRDSVRIHDIEENENENDNPLQQIEEDKGYKISAPPPQRSIDMDEDMDEDQAVTPPTLEDDGGSVTPPLIDDFVTTSAFPDIAGDTVERSNTLEVDKKAQGSGRRTSKAYHGYQPSWAVSNKPMYNFYQHNTATANTNYFDQGYTNTNYGGSFRASIYGGDDSDDDLDDELDFRKAKPAVRRQNSNTFSRRYVSANRNQSIMRYQDILDQSTKAVKDIKRVSDKMMTNDMKRVSDNMLPIVEDDFTPRIFPTDDTTYTAKRVSRYSNVSQRKGTYGDRKSSNVSQRKESYDHEDDYNNYSSAVEKAQSISSTHSYGRQFGGSSKGKRKKSKGSMLKKMNIFAWGK